MRKICLILILTIIVAIPMVLVSHAGTPIVPIPFSADYTVTDEYGELIEKGRYYIGAEGIRMEIESEGEFIVTITNLHKGLHFVIMEEEKMYIENAIFTGEGEPFTKEDLLSEMGIGTPCPIKQSKTKHLDREVINGRTVEKWECHDTAEDEVITIWFDTRLKTGIKTECDGEIFEFHNIKEGRLSGDLFNAPVGYMQFALPVGSFFQD